MDGGGGGGDKETYEYEYRLYWQGMYINPCLKMCQGSLNSSGTSSLRSSTSSRKARRGLGESMLAFKSSYQESFACGCDYL